MNLKFEIMKKLISILFFCLFTIIITGQTSYKNHIILVFQPEDCGLGFRYDRMHNKSVGNYISLTKGDYNFGNDNFIKDHIKVGLGILLQANDPATSYYTVGLIYNSYGIKDLTGIEDQFNTNMLNPISFELGVTAIINRFTGGFRMDILKWEGCFEFGFVFN